MTSVHCLRFLMFRTWRCEQPNRSAMARCVSQLKKIAATLSAVSFADPFFSPRLMVPCLAASSMFEVWLSQRRLASALFVRFPSAWHATIPGIFGPTKAKSTSTCTKTDLERLFIERSTRSYPETRAGFNSLPGILDLNPAMRPFTSRSTERILPRFEASYAGCQPGIGRQTSVSMSMPNYKPVEEIK